MTTFDGEIILQAQQLWKEEAGIELTIEEADELLSTISAFADLLFEWDEKDKNETDTSINDSLDEIDGKSII